jgi:hypothetical protein
MNGAKGVDRMKTVVLVTIFTLVAAGATAQNPSAPTPSATTTVEPAERLTFDRPEAWALKYFVSSTMLSGLDVPGNHRAGSISVGLEMGWLPALSTAQQRVGFNGLAFHDLNKAPIMVRPRVAVGLPGRIAVTVAGNPPVRSFGVTPRLVSGAIEWAMIDRRDWRLALRGHGQTGTVTGAFTCPASVLDSGPGFAGNPGGCTSESADVATLRYAGLELAASHRAGAITPHVAVGGNYIDSRYEVRAQAYGRPDHDLLETAGWTISTSAGIGYAFTERLSIAGDAFYSPLMVRRNAAAQRTLDSFLNARGLLVYRIR